MDVNVLRVEGKSEGRKLVIVLARRAGGDKRSVMHAAKIARISNGMGCDGQVPLRENTLESLCTFPQMRSVV